MKSSPAFKFNDGTPSPFAISGIKISGENVSFTVYNSSDIVPKATDVLTEVYQDAAILTWVSDVEGYSGDATVSWGQTSGSMKTEKVSPYADGKYSITLEGLSPTTAYTVIITYDKNGVTGDSVTSDFLTKALVSEGRPYIYLEYLSGIRSGGVFPAGTGLPLRVYNAVGERISWSYDGTTVQTDDSGYFHPAKSGTLKAVVYHSDGSQDILYKEIIIK